MLGEGLRCSAECSAIGTRWRSNGNRSLSFIECIWDAQQPKTAGASLHGRCRRCVALRGRYTAVPEPQEQSLQMPDLLCRPGTKIVESGSWELQLALPGSAYFTSLPHSACLVTISSKRSQIRRILVCDPVHRASCVRTRRRRASAGTSSSSSSSQQQHQ